MPATAAAERRQPDARAAARDYIARGWAPIPVPARSKNPNREGWPHERHAAADVDRLFKPAGNIGVLLGEASGGLCDVDLDCPEAIEAAPSFLPVTESRFGRASKPGSHYWYVVTDEPKLQSVKFFDVTHAGDNGKKACLVELRALSEKGTPLQTIVPPSLHEETGELIEWEATGEPARVTAVALRAAVAKIAAGALLARRWPDGARHDASLALAGLLLRGGMAEHDAEHFVETVARVAGDHEWHDRVQGVRNTAKTVAAGGAATGGPRLAELLADGEAVVSRLRDWLGLDAAAQLEADGQQIHIVNLADFLVREIPARETILAPWLPTQGLAMVFAERGVGKTYFALSVAYAAATGGAFLRWSAARPWRVLYLDGEMPAVAIQERLAMLVRATSVEPPSADSFRLYTPDLQSGPLIDLASATSHGALAPYVAEADIIFADNISTLTSGNENEAEDWRPVASWGLMLRRQGKTLVLVHHAGKNGEQRGISKREDVLDTVIVLRRPTDYQPEQGARFEIHFKKHRSFYGDDAKPFEAQLASDENGKSLWTVKSLEECMTERVAKLRNDGLTQRDIAKALSVGIGTVNRHAQKARLKGWIR